MYVYVFFWYRFLFSPGMIEGSSGTSSCTVTYVGGTTFVSCVDSTSSGYYQVILLQDNDPYNLTVVNVGPGEKQTVPVVASGRYCIMELPMRDNYFEAEVKYSKELKFTAEETVTPPSTVDVIGITSKSMSALSKYVMEVNKDE